MAKTYLNEENMRDIIWGATLMAAEAEAPFPAA